MRWVNAHRSFGIAHSARPPATEAGESTQISVMLTAFAGRDPVLTRWATSSSP